MPTTKYNIYVKEILCFTKYTKKEFDKICSDMDFLSVKYRTEIIEI